MRNVYQETLNELREVVENGGLSKLRRRTREYTPITPIKTYTPHEIKALREEKLNYTQSFFGELLGVSLKTIQAWESGTNKPNGTALRIFQVLEQDPHALDQYIMLRA